MTTRDLLTSSQRYTNKPPCFLQVQDGHTSRGDPKTPGIFLPKKNDDNMDVFAKLRAKRDELDQKAENIRIEHNISTDSDARQRLSSELALVQRQRAELAEEFQEARDVNQTLKI